MASYRLEQSFGRHSLQLGAGYAIFGYWIFGPGPARILDIRQARPLGYWTFAGRGRLKKKLFDGELLDLRSMPCGVVVVLHCGPLTYAAAVCSTSAVKVRAIKFGGCAGSAVDTISKKISQKKKERKSERKSGYWIFVQGDLWILDIRIPSTSEFSVSGPCGYPAGSPRESRVASVK